MPITAVLSLQDLLHQQLDSYERLFTFLRIRASTKYTSLLGTFMLFIVVRSSLENLTGFFLGTSVHF